MSTDINIKDLRKTYDSAITHKKGTKNLWCRFSSKGLKVDCSTKTDNWDEAQEFVLLKRQEIADQHVHGKKNIVTFDEAWQLYVDTFAANWSASKSTEKNDRNMFDRMTGQMVIRSTIPTVKELAVDPTLVPTYWTPMSVDCLSKVDSVVLQNLHSTRIKEGASRSQSKAEIDFIKRLIKCMHRYKKKVPAMDTLVVTIKAVKNNRRRMVTAAEILEIVSYMNEDDADYILALAFSGSRSMEMAKAKWSSVEMDANNNLLSIWLYNEKTDEIYSKPLVDESGNLLLFGELLTKRFKNREKQFDWIFPMQTKPEKHRNQSTDFWHKAISNTTINDPETVALIKNNGEKLVPHHLRHFAGQQLASQGLSQYVIQRHLNHADGRTAAMYMDQVENPVAKQTMSNIDSLFKNEGKS